MLQIPSPDERRLPSDSGGGTKTKSAKLKKQKFYSTVLGVGCVLVLLVTVCRGAMLGTAYDYALHFFEAGLPLQLLNGLTAVTVLLAFSGILLFRKSDADGYYPAPSSAETLFSALCGFFLIATVIMQCIYTVSGLEIGRYTVENSWFIQLFRSFRAGTPAGNSETGQTLQFLALAAAIPGGIYFLYTAFLEKPKRGKQAGLCLFFLMWTAFCLLVVNFDVSLPMNSPERLGPIAAFLSAMLFAASEMRYLLGKGRLSLIFFSGLLTMLFCFSDALPTILFSFAGRFNMGISTIYACAELSLSLYALLRLRSFRRQADSAPAEPAAETRAPVNDTAAAETATAGSVREETPADGNSTPDEEEIFPLAFSSSVDEAEQSAAAGGSETDDAGETDGAEDADPSSADGEKAQDGGREPRRRPSRTPRL